MAIERASLSDAAASLSERIASEGLSLQPEFDNRSGTAEDEPRPEAEAPEAEQEASTEPEAEAEGTEDAEDRERFELPQGLNDLAVLLGLDPGEMYGLTVNVDVGEESKPYTLEELKALALEPARDDVERKRWFDQKRAEEAEIKAQKEALDQKRNDADLMASIVFSNLNAQEQQLAGAYQALLRNVEYQSRDPQAYQIELLRHKAAIEDVQSQKQGLMAQMDQIRQQMQHESEQHRLASEASGRKRLRAMIPEWTDDDGFETGAAELRRYVQQERFGTTDAELAGTLDPRVLYWAEMSRRYEALQEAAKQKPKPTPTARLAPGAQQVRLPRGRRAELEAMDRLKKSGSVDDARTALAQRLRQTR